MAAPLTLLLIVAVTIRAVLFRSSLADLISERVEVVSPLNAWKRVVEGLALLDLGVSPYAGDVFHETPLIIYFFHFVIDYAEIVFMMADALTAVALYIAVKDYNKIVELCTDPYDMGPCIIMLKHEVTAADEWHDNGPQDLVTFRKQKYALEANRYPLNCQQLFRTPKEMYYIPLKVAMFYLLNPFTILSCVAKSTCGLNNAVIALFILCTIKGSALMSAIFLALATYQSIYPLTLFAPALLYLLQRLYIPVNWRRPSFWLFTTQYAFMYLGSLCVMVCLSFFLLSSWDFLSSVYGFISHPNIGLFWYFFAEMFEHFRLFFICVFQINVFFYTIPLSIKLKEHPFFLIFMQIAIISIFKSYPTVGDIALYMAFLPAWNHLYRFLRNIFLVSVVLLACSALFPVLWHLWIYAGSANSNFYYAITLLFNVAQILMVSDYFYAYLRREHHLTHGLYLKRKDGSEATLVLK